MSSSPPRKIVRLNEEDSCKGCKKLRKDIKELTTKMEDQNKIILETLAKQTGLITKLVSEENEAGAIGANFPLCNEKELQDADQIICFNRQIYVKAIRNKLGGKIARNLENILHRDVVIMYNVDGTHGKKRLKDFKNLYSAIMDAIPDAEKENAIRKAFQKVKKRHFRQICTKNKDTP